MLNLFLVLCAVCFFGGAGRAQQFHQDGQGIHRRLSPKICNFEFAISSPNMVQTWSNNGPTMVQTWSNKGPTMVQTQPKHRPNTVLPVTCTMVLQWVCCKRRRLRDRRRVVEMEQALALPAGRSRDRPILPVGPKFPPLPEECPAKWERWSPEWFTNWMIQRINNRMMKRRETITQEEREKYLTRRMVLENRLCHVLGCNDEDERVKVHLCNKRMLDLTPDSTSTVDPDMAHNIAREATSDDNLTEDDGYFDPGRVPGRDRGVSSSAYDSGGHDDHDGETTPARVRRYIMSSRSEVSDEEFWRYWHETSNEED